MEQGPVERRILETCMREGLPIPKKMQDAPVLQSGLELFLMAFADLHVGRPVNGDGIEMPLSWDLIDRWCQSYGIFGEGREDVFAHIRSLDTAYLNWQRSKVTKGKRK